MFEEGPCQEKARELYADLRRNVIENTFKEYQRTGYVWEQYDAITGEGRRRQVGKLSFNRQLKDVLVTHSLAGHPLSLSVGLIDSFPSYYLHFLQYSRKSINLSNK